MEKENKTGIQELKNEAVEEAMKAFLADKTNQTMANLMAVMRDARFLVPADFPPDVKKQVIEKAKRGEKVDTKIAPRMLPIIVQNQNGEHFAPAYTSIEQMKTNAQYPAFFNHLCPLSPCSEPASFSAAIQYRLPNTVSGKNNT